LAFIQCNE